MSEIKAKNTIKAPRISVVLFNIIMLALVCGSIVAIISLAIVFSALTDSLLDYKSRLYYSEESRKISNEQIIDMARDIQDLRTKNQTMAIQSYVSGIIEGISEKDRYSEIWHEGYNSGIMQNTVSTSQTEDKSLSGITASDIQSWEK